MLKNGVVEITQNGILRGRSHGPPMMGLVPLVKLRLMAFATRLTSHEDSLVSGYGSIIRAFDRYFPPPVEREKQNHQKQ